MTQERPIRWIPEVCQCVIMQGRTDPDTNYEFSTKCDLHKEMTDQNARQDIIQLCIAGTEKFEGV